MQNDKSSSDSPWVQRLLLMQTEHFPLLQLHIEAFNTNWLLLWASHRKCNKFASEGGVYHHHSSWTRLQNKTFCQPARLQLLGDVTNSFLRAPLFADSRRVRHKIRSRLLAGWWKQANYCLLLLLFLFSDNNLFFYLQKSVTCCIKLRLLLQPVTTDVTNRDRNVWDCLYKQNQDKVSRDTFVK